MALGESSDTPRGWFHLTFSQSAYDLLTWYNLEATRDEMRQAKLPLAYRDSCAHLLIPLNRCRYETYYLPWKCEVRMSPGGRL